MNAFPTLLPQVGDVPTPRLSLLFGAVAPLIEEPRRLSQAILRLGLDKNGSLEILSLKIEVIHPS